MENKTSKYFKYAIGEIVLVVIGILIALQINNWNQERISRATSNELLQGIVKDLDQDISTLNSVIDQYDERLAFMERQMTKTDFSSTHTDTLFLIMDGGTIPFTITDQSYEKAKNLGITQLCTDDSLAMRISEYYTQTADFIKVIVDFEFSELVKDNDFWMKDQEEIEFEYGISFDIPLIQDSISRRSNVIKALMSPLGRNHVKSECYTKQSMRELQTANRETAVKLREDLVGYLNQ